MPDRSPSPDTGEETWTIIRWRCPECGETEATGPLVNSPESPNGELGHCAKCLDDYPAPDAIEVVRASRLQAVEEELKEERAGWPARSDYMEWYHRAEAAEAEVERLRRALEPFALAGEEKVRRPINHPLLPDWIWETAVNVYRSSLTQEHGE